jgi:hypothetical protein
MRSAMSSEVGSQILAMLDQEDLRTGECQNGQPWIDVGQRSSAGR